MIVHYSLPGSSSSSPLLITVRLHQTTRLWCSLKFTEVYTASYLHWLWSFNLEPALLGVVDIMMRSQTPGDVSSRRPQRSQPLNHDFQMRRPAVLLQAVGSSSWDSTGFLSVSAKLHRQTSAYGLRVCKCSRSTMEKKPSDPHLPPPYNCSHLLLGRQDHCPFWCLAWQPQTRQRVTFWPSIRILSRLPLVSPFFLHAKEWVISDMIIGRVLFLFKWCDLADLFVLYFMVSGTQRLCVCPKATVSTFDRSLGSFEPFFNCYYGHGFMHCHLVPS